MLEGPWFGGSGGDFAKKTKLLRFKSNHESEPPSGGDLKKAEERNGTRTSAGSCAGIRHIPLNPCRSAIQFVGRDGFFTPSHDMFLYT